MTRRMVELYSGSGNMAAAFRIAGYMTMTIDNDVKVCPDYLAHIGNVTGKDIRDYIGSPIDVIWASPPCQVFSIASKLSNNWDHGKPKSEEAYGGLATLADAIRLITELSPRFWYIENPRGMMRKMPMMKWFPRRTFTFCQYGDRAMKPTDVWTNNQLWWPKMCRNGSSCHEPAPRGSKTGTQGKSGAKERGTLPPLFCKEIEEVSR